ncbi:MAG: DUF3796 domain-containing protein [Paenisporosarcina sp.]
MLEGQNLVTALSGYFISFITIWIVFHFVRKSGKKKRLFDERYHQVQNKARSLAWVISTFCIVAAWMASLIVEGPGFSFFLLTFVYVAHMIAFAIGGIIAEKKF